MKLTHHFRHILLAKASHQAWSVSKGVGKRAPSLDGKNGKMMLRIGVGRGTFAVIFTNLSHVPCL